ncbi:class I SAM-dependent methyltransferase [Conexibacter arvalis]|uniref:SAM-dependent methyltransferase n=1 Tax=Conexibacter arvalis TaxID=912552 RepID=A0A840IBN3_9ACTN|nr:class I SAM-dependent methyltransferase [Conexibacter arvalis]MBB4661514.1 SAM-dependent methyltransferase [Conexibacter arvalis]
MTSADPQQSPPAVACRLCGRPTEHAFTTCDRNRRISDERFDYVACPCGTLTLANVPDDLGPYYPPDYYGMPASADEAIARDRNALHRLELVRRLVPAGRLLEIGPMTGGFLELARRAGYDVSGVELDDVSCRFIAEVLGIAVTQSDDPASVIEGPYDAIVMWHVVEHLAEPARFIERAAAALAPGGALVLIAPNPRSLQLRLLGPRWAHVDAPRHLALLPHDALAAEGARNGLELVHATASDEDGRRSNDFGWAVSFARSSRDERVARWLQRCGHALCRIVAPLERRGMRGASYTLALRRPA